MQTTTCSDQAVYVILQCLYIRLKASLLEELATWIKCHRQVSRGSDSRLQKPQNVQVHRQASIIDPSCYLQSATTLGPQAPKQIQPPVLTHIFGSNGECFHNATVVKTVEKKINKSILAKLKKKKKKLCVLGKNIKLNKEKKKRNHQILVKNTFKEFSQFADYAKQDALG